MQFLQLAANGISQGLLIGIAALSITLVFGVARFPNAATGDVMTLGAYAGLAAHGATHSLLVAGVAAVAAGAVAGIAGYWLVFSRLAGRSVVSLLVASVGVAFVIRAGLGLAFGQARLWNSTCVQCLKTQSCHWNSGTKPRKQTPT